MLKKHNCILLENTSKILLENGNDNDEKLYDIGKKYNLITKYNIRYDRRSILDYACAVYVSDLLKEKYPLTDELKNKLNVILNNLIVL